MTARKFAFDVSWGFIGKIITLATGFLLCVILGRPLDVAIFGLFMMIFAVYTVASLVGRIGIEKLNIFVPSSSLE